MQHQIKKQLKEEILKLCSYCEELFLGDLEREVYVKAATVFLENYDEERLMERMIEKTSPHWNKIIVKDENFFLKESDKIFGELPISIDLFSSLFSKDFLSRDEKNKIWSYFHTFVKLACQYIHYMRGPVAIYDGNRLVSGEYSKDFKKNIEIKPCVKALNFKLKFT